MPLLCIRQNLLRPAGNVLRLYGGIGLRYAAGGQRRAIGINIQQNISEEAKKRCELQRIERRLCFELTDSPLDETRPICSVPAATARLPASRWRARRTLLSMARARADAAVQIPALSQRRSHCAVRQSRLRRAGAAPARSKQKRFPKPSWISTTSAASARRRWR